MPSVEVWNLAANVAALVVICACAVWVHRNHVRIVELRAEVAQVTVLLSLRVNGGPYPDLSHVQQPVEHPSELDSHG